MTVMHARIILKYQLNRPIPNTSLFVIYLKTISYKRKKIKQTNRQKANRVY